MTTIKTYTQKAADFMTEKNLAYSPEVFNYILEVIKASPKNIAEEELRLANLNNQRVNENYNLLSNMCYSKK
jgi:hypothetical protein